MSKTKTITISTSDEVRLTSRRDKSIVVIDDPEIEEMLADVKKEDIIAHIQSQNYKPEEVFEEEDLINWAHSHGYIKE